MVAIEHRSKSSNTTTSTSILSPTSNSSVNSATTSVTSTTSLSTKSTTTLTVNKKMSTEPETSSSSKSAVSQRQVDAKVAKKSHKEKDGKEAAATNNQEATKKSLKLDLKGKETDLESLKSPKSPIGGRLTHQTSLSSSVDVEDRKTLREALYQGIFHRHRRTIFAFGSFLRMLRSRNSQYNSIRSASEGEAEVEEVR